MITCDPHHADEVVDGHRAKEQCEVCQLEAELREFQKLCGDTVELLRHIEQEASRARARSTDDYRHTLTHIEAVAQAAILPLLNQRTSMGDDVPTEQQETAAMHEGDDVTKEGREPEDVSPIESAAGSDMNGIHQRNHPPVHGPAVGTLGSDKSAGDPVVGIVVDQGGKQYRASDSDMQKLLTRKVEAIELKPIEGCSHGFVPDTCTQCQNDRYVQGLRDTLKATITELNVAQGKIGECPGCPPGYGCPACSAWTMTDLRLERDSLVRVVEDLNKEANRQTRRIVDLRKRVEKVEKASVDHDCGAEALDTLLGNDADWRAKLDHVKAENAKLKAELTKLEQARCICDKKSGRHEEPCPVVLADIVEYQRDNLTEAHEDLRRLKFKLELRKQERDEALRTAKRNGEDREKFKRELETYAPIRDEDGHVAECCVCQSDKRGAIIQGMCQPCAAKDIAKQRKEISQLQKDLNIYRSQIELLRTQAQEAFAAGEQHGLTLQTKSEHKQTKALWSQLTQGITVEPDVHELVLAIASLAQFTEGKHVLRLTYHREKILQRLRDRYELMQGSFRNIVSALSFEGGMAPRVVLSGDITETQLEIAKDIAFSKLDI